MSTTDGGRQIRHGHLVQVKAITFQRLEMASFAHSIVYCALLVSAFVLGKPEPETFVLGMTHGLMWIAMSVLCIAAARDRTIPFWLAVTVAVLGGLGPFAGSAGFVMETRRRSRKERPTTAISTRYS